MTLDEMICKQKILAAELDEAILSGDPYDPKQSVLKDQAAEQRQIAGWLEELKKRRSGRN